MESQPCKWKTNWTKCFLCQEEKSESLKLPKDNPTKKDEDGYSKLSTNIPVFQSLNALPINLDPRRLDEGGGIENTLRNNQAKYHESCRLLFNNTKLKRAQKRASGSDVSQESSCGKFPRRSQLILECFLCEKQDSLTNLREAMTMKLNQRLNECAQTLGDSRLLSKLSGGDVVAQELKYHPVCLVALYNRERAYRNSQEALDNAEGSDKQKLYPVVFSELVTYVSEMRNASGEGGAPVILKLADLVSLYNQRLEQLGVKSPDVNRTRLKEQLLLRIPELEAHRKGRDVIFAFRSDVGEILADASKYSEAIHIAKAAEIIRKEMLNQTTKFSNIFQNNAIEEAVPTSLLQFVCMVEHGANIKSQLSSSARKSDLAMAQLLQFNCSDRVKEGASVHRHSKKRETPLAVYIGLSIYSKTRKRQLIELLHDNGMCISYDRVLEITSQLGEAVVNQYVEEGVVCSPILMKNLFTLAAVDNIDHNPTATTASTSFHGTGLSLFQNPSAENPGLRREPLQFTAGSKVKKVPELPESYTNVKPAYISKSPDPPGKPGLSLPDPDSFQSHREEEFIWMEKVFHASELDENTNITWSAHHASQSRNPPFEVSIASLLPLLRDQAHSVATIKHAMGKIQEAVRFLNPGQTPVMAADQPLFALSKQIQWKWPEYGEDKFVIMFGGLHIEMAGLRSLGILLQDSGWTSAIAEAGVASFGTADSFLGVSSVTKTRQAHQITACSLYQLMKEAHDDYCSTSEKEPLGLKSWCEKRQTESPQFKYWSMILDFEVILFTLIRSFREGNFELYREAIAELLPYFFANNNTNYARWLTVHLIDMLSLEKQHPDVAREFHNGNFVVRKSSRAFSAIAIDHAHEHNNAVIKGDGGAVGITEDPAALRRWMVAGPEVTRLLTAYEELSGKKAAVSKTRHHEENLTAQRSFCDKVKKLSSVMKQMGNPFQEDSSDLLVLDTKDVADPAIAKLVSTHHTRGKAQFKAFMEDLLRQESKSFYQPIKKNHIAFFRLHPVPSSSQEKVSSLKDDCQLFSRLFISCQSRQCDLAEFFQHENQTAPASLSDSGRLHSCQKSQLVNILETRIVPSDSEPMAEVLVIDGSALINALPPRTSKTFDDYAREEIRTKLESYCDNYKRVDIVFDLYQKDSLKSETRSKRGNGVRRRVEGSSRTPNNWKSFLRNDMNKTELFLFLADKIKGIDNATSIIATKGQDAVCNKERDLSGVSPCIHEEADTRLFVHIKDAVLEGYTTVAIKANDTDVVVIAVSVFSSLKELGLLKLWVAYGQGTNARWIPIDNIVSAMGPMKSRALLFFHAFTGCDNISAFRGKGKKWAWQTWNVFPEVDKTFVKLSQYPLAVEDEDIKVLERFVVLMYDRSSSSTNVNEARLDLFARKQRTYESIPPTQAALKEHVKRAAFQAGIIWAQATSPLPDIQSPADYGWRKDGDTWKICWTTLPPIAASCQELTKCSCKKDCTRRCKCFKSGLACTALCGCEC